MVLGPIEQEQLIELVLGSLLLPAIVALLVTHWQMNRQSKREKQDWYDSVEAAAARIEGAWYPEDEVTQTKLEDTINVVDSSLGDLKDLKGNPEAGGKLVDSIDFLNRRWFHHKEKIKKHSDKRYERIADATQRDCRQIKYIVQIDRPQSPQGRIKTRFVNMIDWLKYTHKMGFTTQRGHLSTETIEDLEKYFSSSEIDQVIEGKKVISITKPFQTRLLIDTNSTGTHFSMNAFPRISNKGSLRFEKSFRIFPIPEEAIHGEMRLAEEWHLEDKEITREVLYEELGLT